MRGLKSGIFTLYLFKLFEIWRAGKFTCSMCGEEKYLLRRNNIPNSFVPTINGAPGRVCMDCAPSLEKICPRCGCGYTPLDENGVSNFALGEDEKSRVCLYCAANEQNQFNRRIGF